jgi:hypothetical protein
MIYVKPIAFDREGRTQGAKMISTTVRNFVKSQKVRVRHFHDIRTGQLLATIARVDLTNGNILCAVSRCRVGPQGDTPSRSSGYELAVTRLAMALAGHEQPNEVFQTNLKKYLSEFQDVSDKRSLARALRSSNINA